MRKILISINLVLILTVMIMVMGNMTKPVPKVATAKVNVASVKKNTQSAAKKSTEVQEQFVPAELLPPDDAAAKVVEKDVFNQIRSPLANTRVRPGDMTLVGVIENRAAIIRNTIRQQQYNPFLVQAMQASANMSGRPNSARFTQWSQVSGRRTGPVQQYVRLGETMANGFTLEEVSRSRAILVRGNDKMELELQDPSKSRSAASRSGAPRLNATQQFQQAQMYMQSEMIRTMREIQSNSRNSGQSGSRNRR